MIRQRRAGHSTPSETDSCSAKAAPRGASVLADLTGYGTTDDANHMVQPAPGGNGAARAMTLALNAAGLRPEDIGYINAHGTSTPVNEKFETQAIKSAFGD